MEITYSCAFHCRYSLIPYCYSRSNIRGTEQYKDFYDVYVLSQEYPFLYQKLYQAVVETFTNRKTPLTMDTIVFRPEFTEDNQHQARWKSFLGKKKAIMKVSLTEVINRIQIFSKPLLDKPDYVPSLWNPKEGNWN